MDEAKKQSLLLDMAVHAGELYKQYQVITKIRSRCFNQEDKSLEPMAPAFEFIAKIFENDMITSAGAFSKAYNEYNSIGKRR